MHPYPKRLIEVDLPIARISAHARREKSIRHGHISTLHIWWARRPLAACRAVICAALWPDPADELCPQPFREAVARLLPAFAEQVRTDATLANLSQAGWSRWNRLTEASWRADHPGSWADMRYALLDFIADFANWDASTVPAFLETSRALTQAAHEALGGAAGTRPLVVDPFAGGGAIPLEALRVGADAFASDLNPVAVLLNKVVLEYIPKYGNAEMKMPNAEGEEVVFHGLAEAVRYWGGWIKEQAEQELAAFYPADADGATPIAYLWARTVISEAPDDGTGIPVEVPLMRSLWLAKKRGRNRAMRWVRDSRGRVATETVAVTYADGITRRVRRPLLEIYEPKRAAEVENGTVNRGSATCPVTGYTTPVESVRRQLKSRRGGADDARLFAVVTTRPDVQGRFYRLPTPADAQAVAAAAAELERRKAAHTGALSLVPDETLDVRGIRHTWAMIYGMERWGDLFTSRQALALITLGRLVVESGAIPDVINGDFGAAVQTCLAQVLDRQANALTSISRWNVVGEKIEGLFARQAIPMVWDFSEACFFSDATGSFDGALEWVAKVLEANSNLAGRDGHTEHASATDHPLPDDSVHNVITDPPYYDAVAYAYLSDFFYVWLRRNLGHAHRDLFGKSAVPKEVEIVVDRPHELSNSTKDITFYERELTRAFAESRRILRPSGVATIVFASKTTTSWEAILQAVVDAGWTITGSWPIDTEMGSRVAAQGQARLASSIHLVCRPRENADGSLRSGDVGDWRTVLHELPGRIHAWLPRLAAEGVVGADAIFACLGPALEIFSRYSRVEKASGEQVTLGEYLEQVWAAVSKEALAMVFAGADTAGFEEDARLTAMWLWTLSTGGGVGSNGNGGGGEDEEEDEGGDAGDDDEGGPVKSSGGGGYGLEYDAARKIAQGLGAHLEQLTHLVEVKGSKARLLPVEERTGHLFGQESLRSRTSGRSSTSGNPQRSLFDELAEPEEAGWQIDEVGGHPGETSLDRVHQAMLLFASGRSAALRRFVVDEGVGRDERFWRLAQALSALYPGGSNEKRWVDGLLARKRGLGF